MAKRLSRRKERRKAKHYHHEYHNEAKDFSVGVLCKEKVHDAPIASFQFLNKQLQQLPLSPVADDEIDDNASLGSLTSQITLPSSFGNDSILNLSTSTPFLSGSQPSEACLDSSNTDCLVMDFSMNSSGSNYLPVKSLYNDDDSEDDLADKNNNKNDNNSNVVNRMSRRKQSGELLSELEQKHKRAPPMKAPFSLYRGGCDNEDEDDDGDESYDHGRVAGRAERRNRARAVSKRSSSLYYDDDDDSLDENPHEQREVGNLSASVAAPSVLGRRTAAPEHRFKPSYRDKDSLLDNFGLVNSRKELGGGCGDVDQIANHWNQESMSSINTAITEEDDQDDLSSS